MFVCVVYDSFGVYCFFWFCVAVFVVWFCVWLCAFGVSLCVCVLSFGVCVFVGSCCCRGLVLLLFGLGV